MIEKITLRAARANIGLTQKQAAELLGISNKTLGNWENGTSFPSPAHIDLICDLYGISYDDISFRPPIRLKRI